MTAPAAHLLPPALASRMDAAYVHPDRRVQRTMILTAYFMNAIGCDHDTAWRYAAFLTTDRHNRFHK